MRKIGLYFLIAVLGIYVVAVIVSAVLMAQMKQITYTSNAWGKIIMEAKIDFTESRATRIYNDIYGELREQKENPISDAKKTQIKAICSFSLFPIWRKNYNNPRIMDGDQYSIVRRYENSESVIYGSNAYPLTYRFVYKAIYNAIE